MQYDLALIHAPSVYDFRDRDDVLFAYLSNSDSVHVSPIFEMPPVGIFALQQHARKKDYRARFFNVASRMLRDPTMVGSTRQSLPSPTSERAQVLDGGEDHRKARAMILRGARADD